jgi:uncharacterized membrane protein
MMERAETQSAAIGWRRVVLPASIVLNLFLAALVVGHLLRPDVAMRREATPLSQAIAQAVSSLSPGDAAAFCAVLQQDAPHYLGAAKQLAEARLNLERQITTEPFDPVSVTAALTLWQAQWNRFTNGIAPAIVDALGQLSPDGRRRIIAARHQANPSPHMP